MSLRRPGERPRPCAPALAVGSTHNASQPSPCPLSSEGRVASIPCDRSPETSEAHPLLLPFLILYQMLTEKKLNLSVNVNLNLAFLSTCVIIFFSKTVPIFKGNGHEEGKPQSYKQTDRVGPKSNSQPSRPDCDKEDPGEEAVVMSRSGSLCARGRAEWPRLRTGARDTCHPGAPRPWPQLQPRDATYTDRPAPTARLPH